MPFWLAVVILLIFIVATTFAGIEWYKGRDLFDAIGTFFVAALFLTIFSLLAFLVILAFLTIIGAN